MDESTIEVIERPSTPAEARLHHEIEGLKLMVAEISARLLRLELLKRLGDD